MTCVRTLRPHWTMFDLREWTHERLQSGEAWDKIREAMDASAFADDDSLFHTLEAFVSAYHAHFMKGLTEEYGWCLEESPTFDTRTAWDTARARLDDAQNHGRAMAWYHLFPRYDIYSHLCVTPFYRVAFRIRKYLGATDELGFYLCLLRKRLAQAQLETACDRAAQGRLTISTHDQYDDAEAYLDAMLRKVGMGRRDAVRLLGLDESADAKHIVDVSCRCAGV